MRLRGTLTGDGAAGVGIPTGTSGVAGFAAAGVLIFRAAVAGRELPERRRRRRRELAACNSAYSKGGRSSGATSVTPRSPFSATGAVTSAVDSAGAGTAGAVFIFSPCGSFPRQRPAFFKGDPLPTPHPPLPPPPFAPPLFFPPPSATPAP